MPAETTLVAMPGDIRFAASELLGTAQRFRLLAYNKRRREAGPIADELIRGAERLEQVAYQMIKEADHAK